MRLKLFYHIVDLPGWQTIVADQVSTLSKSGLLSQVDKAYFCTNGRVDSFFTAKKAIEGKFSTVEFVHTSDTVELMEWPTLNFLKNNVDDDPNDFYVCYMHVKGISHKPSSHITSWRQYLDFWMLEKWEFCVKMLDKYETVGNTSTATLNGVKQTNIYSGNYWWARSSYIKRLTPLPCPKDIAMGSVSPYTGSRYTLENFRYDHENWIGSKEPIWGTIGS